MARIFISYKRVDKDTVFPLKDKIQSEIGEKCWIDLEGIESDAQFKSVIIKAINDCEIFLFMYSKVHSQIVDFENDWTVRELSFAKLKNKRIVFINIDGSPLSDLFLFDYSTKQQVDGRSQEALERLFADLRKWLKIQESETPVVTPSEEKSPSPIKKAGEMIAEEILFPLKEIIVPEGEDAITAYRKAAMQGIAAAQYSLGKCYEKGEGVPKKRADAIRWYRKAAEQGHAQAQYALTLSLWDDPEEADKWCRESAAQGYVDAQVHLGDNYYNGWGVAADFVEAVKWYRKAAEKGDATAQSRLGFCYKEGEGVKQDIDEAIKWFRKAAEQGDEEAIEELESM